MNKKVFALCGVESTGKTTTANKLLKKLTNNGYKVALVGEVGREVCENSGGVFGMTYLDYEEILFLHQSNFLRQYQNKNIDIILLDTDSVYTQYYLKKDKVLNKQNKNLYKKLTRQATDIAKLNSDKIETLIYLNSDCPFVQDGTRTYQSTREKDDKILKTMYNENYKNNQIHLVCGQNFKDRFDNVYSFIINKLNK